MPPRFHVPAKRFALSDTARAEAFSDAVFAIAMTLLVLGLTTPAHPPGGLGDALARQWPAYLGYAASFSYIAVIWLNHHRAFLRIRSMDRGLHAANLLLLFTTAALAFPTDVVATELQADAWGTDAKVAVVLYAALAAAMCLSWAALYHHLHRRPELLEGTIEPTYVRHGSLRSWIGALAYALAGVLGVLVTPLAALGAFVLLPVFYFTTSEGLPGSQDASDDAAA
ncbi:MULTISPECIES: TMEM175 family protein [unclassified Streptomyces]|uniref:TMEM175 family protein n=1 Tax=unclassified Streptomyces TaxID=2593676 RepID=UPI0033F9920A